MLTALELGLGFVALGKLIFKALSISGSHFLVAGGLILLLLAARNLLIVGERRESVIAQRRRRISGFFL